MCRFSRSSASSSPLPLKSRELARARFIRRRVLAEVVLVVRGRMIRLGRPLLRGLLDRRRCVFSRELSLGLVNTRVVVLYISRVSFRALRRPDVWIFISSGARWAGSLQRFVKAMINHNGKRPSRSQHFPGPWRGSGRGCCRLKWDIVNWFGKFTNRLWLSRWINARAGIRYNIRQLSFGF